MTEPSEGISTRLHNLRARFSDALPERMAEVHQLADSLRAARGAEAFETARQALLFPVHKLAGSAATMGHPRLGGYAQDLESVLGAWRDGRTTLTPDDLAVLDGKLEDMADAASRNAPALDDDEENGAPQPTDGELEQSVLLLHGDGAAGDDIAQQLGNFGYAVTIYADADAFENAARHIRPEAFVVDLDTVGGLERGLRALDAVAACRPTIPLFVTTAHNDIKTRLRTVRAGASAVLPHPVDIHELVQVLDRFTVAGDATPYRVLIVDDDQDMAYFYELMLQGARFETLTITNPLDVLEQLSTFEPDLILMDVNMPECSGIELAAIIRQSRAYLHIPIVFLTADRSAGSHLFAVQAGGDDYLFKPVDKRMLLASVRARAERSRLLTSLISSDSMTGLLNHSSIMEALATELSRAQRHDKPMAFAMLDIDHFKAVNDTHGHWVGDIVIKALAQVLRQRLRKTDVIGRYGGEEFAVILPDADAEQAAQLLDRIREGFTKIRHMGDGDEFFVTFSCGISAFPGIDRVDRIAATADEALYEAKQSGRNRVVVAEENRTGRAI